MNVVLDSNVLFRTLISQGDILDVFFHPRLMIYAPQRLQEEFQNNTQEILAKSRLSENAFETLCSLLFAKTILIPLEKYQYLLPQAKQILGSHQKDEDFIAVCLLKHCKVWTYESRLFDIGYGISTKQLSRRLL